jgi:hypothetical protein
MTSRRGLQLNKGSEPWQGPGMLHFQEVLPWSTEAGQAFKIYCTGYDLNPAPSAQMVAPCPATLTVESTCIC